MGLIRVLIAVSGSWQREDALLLSLSLFPPTAICSPKPFRLQLPPFHFHSNLPQLATGKAGRPRGHRFGGKCGGRRQRDGGNDEWLEAMPRWSQKRRSSGGDWGGRRLRSTRLFLLHSLRSTM